MTDAVVKGLISFGIIAYLAVLGLPNQLGGAVVTTFALAMLLLTMVFFRDKPGRPQTTRTVASKGLVAGLVAGALIAGGIALVASLQRRGVQVIDLFAQLLPEWTEALTGVTREELFAGVSVVGPAIRLGLLITVGGLLGGIATRLTMRTPSGEDSSTFWEGHTGRRIRLGLPVLLFVVFVIISTDAVNIGGADENLIGLLVAFGFIAVTLIAFRAARFDRGRLVSALSSGVLVALLPLFTDQFQDAVLGKVAIFFVVGIGLNIVVGYAGLLDLGYIGFFAVGAYAFGLLSSPESYVVVSLDSFGGIQFWAGLPIAIGFGIIMGLFIGLPVLRLRGDYLAIVTLGFGQIVRIMLVNLDQTGGPGGVLDVPPPILFGIDFGDPQRIFYLALIASALAAFVSLRLRDSRLGRAWVAMREDQDVAQAMGVNVIAAKLFAFATGAAFAGGAGALYAAQQVNIFPDNFRLEVSIAILSAVIIGGLGSVGGVVLGSIALIGLPELLRGVDEFRIVAFGALLVIMMIVRPEGLLPEARRSFELHEADRDQDAWMRAAEVAESQEAHDVAEDATP